MYLCVNFYISNQIFSQAAFIQQLTFKTISDLKHIFLQFIMLLLAFGLIMYLALQREQRLVDDDESIMERVFPYFLLDAIWSQYMMALEERGDAPDVYDSHPWKYVLYIIFFLITLST